MPTDIVVRRAQATDLEGAGKLGGGLARMHHAADPERFFLPDDVDNGYAWWFERELKRPAAVVLVALRAGQVVGYCYGALAERDWNLLIDQHGVVHDLYVDESARQSGVGGQLLDAMLSELTALGAPRIVLYTMVKNESAQRLFRARGFRPSMLEMLRDGSS
jgi:ribosomal protein S18 acetylase RimI-like enzyme